MQISITKRYINSTGGTSSFCTCITYSERRLTPLCVDSFYRTIKYNLIISAHSHTYYCAQKWRFLSLRCAALWAEPRHDEQRHTILTRCVLISSWLCIHLPCKRAGCCLGAGDIGTECMQAITIYFIHPSGKIKIAQRPDFLHNTDRIWPCTNVLHSDLTVNGSDGKRIWPCTKQCSALGSDHERIWPCTK